LSFTTCDETERVNTINERNNIVFKEPEVAIFL